MNTPEVKAKLSEALKKSHKKRREEKAAIKPSELKFKKNYPVARDKGKLIVKNIGIYNTSKLETLIIKLINDLGLTCKQSYMPREINYIFDGYISSKKTLIEVDGKYWHGPKMNEINGAKASEIKKTNLAFAAGYKLIRFKEERLPKKEHELILYIKHILKTNKVL